eukprot:Colp12_sorted_trinity150504_noHs@17339
MAGDALLVIDGAYLTMQRKPLNYVELIRVLERKLKLKFYERWYFASDPDGNRQGNSFFQYLRSAAPSGPQFRVEVFNLKDKTCVCKKCNTTNTLKVQKGVDVSIATLILKHAYTERCAKLVLIAGDGDFASALKILKDELHLPVYIVGSNNRSVSTDLQEVSTSTLWLEDFENEIRRPDHRPELRAHEINVPPALTLGAAASVHVAPLPKSRHSFDNTTSQVNNSTPSQTSSESIREWSCGVCTLLNASNRADCGLCGAPAPINVMPNIMVNFPTFPKLPSKAHVNGYENMTQPEVPSYVNEEWTCGICTLVNVGGQTCTACDAPKPLTKTNQKACPRCTIIMEEGNTTCIVCGYHC